MTAKELCRGRENVGADHRTEEVLTVAAGAATAAAAAEAVVAVVFIGGCGTQSCAHLLT